MRFILKHFLNEPALLSEEDCKNYLKKLRNSYNLAYNIIESISDNLMALDQNWCFLYVNHVLRKYVSALVNEEQLSGKNIWELFPNMVGTEFYQACHKVMREKRPLHFEAPCILYDNKWFQFGIYPFTGGISVFFSDISARKEAEAKLVESRKLFLATLNNSPNMMSIIGLKDLIFKDVNNTWLEKTGYKREEVEGKGISEIAMLAKEQKEGILEKVLEEGSINNEEVTLYKRNKKETLTGLLSAAITQLDNEQIIISTINDITELKKYESEIKRLDSLNLVGEMASSISHEIRNPITTVRGFLQLLSGKEDNAKYLDYYQLMIEELDRTNSIITEFLSLAKNKQVQQEEVELSDIVEHMLPLLESDAVRYNRHLEVDLQKVPMLLLDKKEIRQLLLNLVRNGFEATKTGGKVTIKTYQEGEEVVLMVADNGYGISEEVRQKVGTPFFTTKDSGTGLGLSVCYRIVDRHNGQITFDTSPAGTIFYVKFKSSLS